MFKNNFLKLDMDLLEESFPLHSNSYEISASGVMFFKADIQLDKQGNIIKISSGDKMEVPFKTISARDIKIGPSLGIGAAAIVYEAIYVPMNYPVAVKKVNVMDKNKRAQLLNDLKLLVFDPKNPENICPNLVQLYGAYFEDGDINLILELMDVGSLKDLMEMFQYVNKTQGGINEEAVISYIARECLLGLDYLHRTTHRIHRDIKPANILLNSLGQVKITDFGISKQLNAGITKTFVGTELYMSPERIKGMTYSYSSDLWSLGIVIHELTTGVIPLKPGNGVFDLLDQIVKSKGFPLPATSSKELSNFVSILLDSNPKSRFNAHDLLNHPFIQNYIKVTSNQVARWVSPLLFKFCKRAKNANPDTNQHDLMVEEGGMDIEN